MQSAAAILEDFGANKRAELQEWFESQLAGRRNPFYASVDLRNSGRKFAPVDANLFPAGFNNLSETARKKASAQAALYFSVLSPEPRNIALIPESHSRNLFYWDNIASLVSIIESAGKKAVVAALPGAELPEEVVSHSGHRVKIAKLENVEADLIILNNDLTTGVPDVLREIKIPIIPSPSLGWHSRRKSDYFDEYNKVAENFAARFGFDPWLISTVHSKCGMVNFKTGENLECIALVIEKALSRIRAKYEEYGISSAPYVFIKADSGTYGMGIMTAGSGEEVYEMNKKLRNKMHVVKEGMVNSEVMIQEGIPTSDSVMGNPAEPFIYLVNNYPVGGVFRSNENRDEFGNLNSSGMKFTDMPCAGEITGDCEFQPAGLLSRLAGVAMVNEGGAS